MKLADCLLVRPKKADALLLLAHGAGAGMRHPFMEALAAALGERGVATLRYEFPYMAAGKKRPDTPKVAMATVEAAMALGREIEPKLPLFAGGKSFGSRMSTMAVAAGLLPEVKGIVCFGFPLHPPKKPASERAAHLADVPVPILFLQGTRDDLADVKLMKQAAKPLREADLHFVEGADHSFGVLKSSGRTAAEVLAELADETRRFVKER